MKPNQMIHLTNLCLLNEFGSNLIVCIVYICNNRWNSIGVQLLRSQYVYKTLTAFMNGSKVINMYKYIHNRINAMPCYAIAIDKSKHGKHAVGAFLFINITLEVCCIEARFSMRLPLPQTQYICISFYTSTSALS